MYPDFNPQMTQGFEPVATDEGRTVPDEMHIGSVVGTAHLSAEADMEGLSNSGTPGLLDEEEQINQTPEPPPEISAESQEDLLDPEIVKNLKDVGDLLIKMDDSVREMRMRMYKKLINYFEGEQLVYWDESVANWRPIGLAQDLVAEDEDVDLDAYAKVANVFKSDIVSIIAALTVSPPKLKAIPDDADNSLDIDTARQYQLIIKKIEKQKNTNPKAMVTRALKIKYTQGLVFAYVYPMEDSTLGHYSEPIVENQETPSFTAKCINCGAVVFDSGMEQNPLSAPNQNMAAPQLSPQQAPPELNPLASANTQQPPEGGICPTCGYEGMFSIQMGSNQQEVVTGYATIPKTRICIDLYGGLNVCTPLFITNQSQIPMLELATEMHMSEVMEKYGLNVESKDNADEYKKQLRFPRDYYPDYNDIVTLKQRWYRPYSFNILPIEQATIMKQQYPKGCYAVFLNDNLLEIYEEELDQRWVVVSDPLQEYLHCPPEGRDALDMQDMVNEMLNLTLDTIEHGIPETFVTPQVLDLGQYKSVRARPGNMTQVKTPRAGLSLQGEFFQTQSASLSQEHNSFSARLMELKQIITGAQPTIYGGALKGGSNTAKEYETSRAMSLQRLAPIWEVVKRMYCSIMELAVPMYIATMRGDDRFVEDLHEGGFVNIIIEKNKLSGRVGEITYDQTEQIPISWAEERDMLMELIKMNSPLIGNLLMAPQNASFIKSHLSLQDLYIPGDEDRQKQLAEISELIKGQPTPNPAFQQFMMAPPQMTAPGMPPPMPPPQMISSIPIDPDIDNHQVEMDTCLVWLKSALGRAMKQVNPPGWENVKLHMMEHKQIMMQQMMQQMQQQMAAGGPPPQ